MSHVPHSPRRAFTHPLIPAASILSMVTAGLHGGVTGAHFEEWFGYGLFFLLATLAQFLLGAFLLFRSWETRAALADPYPRVRTEPTPLEPLAYLAGAIGNALIALMYLVTRTVGIPYFGPEAGEVEAWDVFGVLTTVLEVMLVILLLHMRRDWRADLRGH